VASAVCASPPNGVLVGSGVSRHVCEDRDNPGRYFNIVFFDSYEDAMENSDLPVTQEFSQRMMALGDGPPSFYNLEVVEDRG
jgi:hypothetical protein